MADLLGSAMEWLTSELKAEVSRSVTYRRGTKSVSVLATLGSQLLRVSDRMGNTKVERTDRDFIIRAADLILDGALTTPMAGDQIDVTFGLVTYRFQVMAPGGEAPWRYSDAHQNLLRIHTKRTGTV